MTPWMWCAYFASITGPGMAAAVKSLAANHAVPVLVLITC
jgi:hypothetical protein